MPSWLELDSLIGLWLRAHRNGAEYAVLVDIHAVDSLSVQDALVLDWAFGCCAEIGPQHYELEMVRPGPAGGKFMRKLSVVRELSTIEALTVTEVEVEATGRLAVFDDVGLAYAMCVVLPHGIVDVHHVKADGVSFGGGSHCADWGGWLAGDWAEQQRGESDCDRCLHGRQCIKKFDELGPYLSIRCD